MTYNYEKFFMDKLEFVIKRSSVMVDIGGGMPPAKLLGKMLGRFHALMQGKKFTTLDIDPATKPVIVGDAHDLPFADASIDAVFHVYVFEHLHTPWKAADEIYRVLKPGGYMLGVVPFIHPYHARKDGYRDYWRFSKDGLEVLFGKFETVELFKFGGYFRAMIGFLPFLWRVKKIAEPLAYLADRLVRKSRNTTAGYIIFAKK